MPFSRPDLTEIKDRIEADLAAEVDNSNTFLRRSVFKILAKILAGVAYLIYEFLQYIKDQIFITTADAENLQIHGAEYGISKDFGTKSSGSLSITGTNGSIVSAGAQLQSSTGNLYNVTANATIATGSATLTIQADEAGIDYNEETGAVFTFTSIISGVNSRATVLSPGITGGVDEETDEEYRDRILLRKRRPPHGGAEFDYITWAYEYSSTVTRAWTVPEYYGIGTIGLAFVKDEDESSIFPTPTERTAMRNYVIAHTDSVTGQTVGIPVTAEPGFFVIDLQPKPINLTIQLYPNNTSVQTTARAAIESLFLTDAGPGKTIYLSRLYEAMGSAVGEEHSKITYPTSDIGAGTNELQVLGTITWSNYSG